MTKDKLEVQTTLEFLIEFNGIRPTDLAKEIGVSRQALHHWTSGSRVIADAYIEPLAEAIGVSPAMLKNGLTIEERMSMKKKKLIEECKSMGIDFDRL